MAKAVAILLGIVVLFVAIRYALAQRANSTDGGTVTLRDVPKLMERLIASGKDGAFWVVLVPETARADGLAANLQVSIEGGVAGLDWVLIAQRNVEDRAKFVEVITAQGLTPKELVANRVRYIRVADADRIAVLCETVLMSMYGVTESTQLQLVVTDFSWP